MAMAGTASRLAALMVAFCVLAGATCERRVAAPDLRLPPPDSRMLDPNYCGWGTARKGDDAVVAIRRKDDALECEKGINKAWRDRNALLTNARAEVGK